MKRTIKEVYDLIKDKRDNAEKEAKSVNVIGGRKVDKTLKLTNLLSTISAYSDVLCLIESSHLLDINKALEIIKKRGAGIIIAIKKYDSYEEWVECHLFHKPDGTKEEFDLLKEVLL